MTFFVMARNALRKTTLPPGMSILGSISLAEDTTFAYPDTVILEYRVGISGIAELGRYGRAVDSLPSSAATRSPTASGIGPTRPSTP